MLDCGSRKIFDSRLRFLIDAPDRRILSLQRSSTRIACAYGRLHCDTRGSGIVLFGQMAGDIVRFPEERRMLPNPLHDIGAFTE